MFIISKHSVERIFKYDSNPVYQKRKKAVFDILNKNPNQSSICLSEFIDIGNGFHCCFYRSAVTKIIHRLNLNRIRDDFYINILFAIKKNWINMFADDQLFQELIEGLKLECTKENLEKRENLQKKYENRFTDTVLWMLEYLPSSSTYARPLRHRKRPISSFLDGDNQFYDIHVIDCVFRCIEDEVTGYGFSFTELKSCLTNSISSNSNA